MLVSSQTTVFGEPPTGEAACVEAASDSKLWRNVRPPFRKADQGRTSLGVYPDVEGPTRGRRRRWILRWISQWITLWKTLLVTGPVRLSRRSSCYAAQGAAKSWWRPLSQSRSPVSRETGRLLTVGSGEPQDIEKYSASLSGISLFSWQQTRRTIRTRKRSPRQSRNWPSNIWAGAVSVSHPGSDVTQCAPKTIVEKPVDTAVDNTVNNVMLNLWESSRLRRAAGGSAVANYRLDLVS